MKLKSIFPLLLGGLFFITLNATNPPVSDPETPKFQVEIASVDDFRIELSGQNLTGKAIQLRVVSRDFSTFGYVTETEFYAETIEDCVPSFKRLLNLSHLQKGTYEVELRAGKHRFSRRVEVLANSRAAEPLRTVSLQ